MRFKNNKLRIMLVSTPNIDWSTSVLMFFAACPDDLKKKDDEATDESCHQNLNPCLKKCAHIKWKMNELILLSDLQDMLASRMKVIPIKGTICRYLLATRAVV